MGPSRCTAGKWGLQPLPSEQLPVLHGALQSLSGAGRTPKSPSCSLCSAGVGRTGVFITLSIVLERMRYEGVVDMFQMVKTLRTQRPAMVQTEVSWGSFGQGRGLMSVDVGPSTRCPCVPTAHVSLVAALQDQYQLCYRAALEYLGSFDHYAT